MATTDYRQCVLALLVGLGCGILLTTLPQIAFHQKHGASNSSSRSYPITTEEKGRMVPVELRDDIHSLLTKIQTINLVLDDAEIELTGLQVEWFELNGPSDGGLANVTWHMSSYALLKNYLRRQADMDNTVDLSVYHEEGVTTPKSRGSPITRRQYLQNPAQKAAKKALRKERQNTGLDGTYVKTPQMSKMGLLPPPIAPQKYASEVIWPEVRNWDLNGQFFF